MSTRNDNILSTLGRGPFLPRLFRAAALLLLLARFASSFFLITSFSFSSCNSCSSSSLFDSSVTLIESESTRTRLPALESSGTSSSSSSKPKPPGTTFRRPLLMTLVVLTLALFATLGLCGCASSSTLDLRFLPTTGLPLSSSAFFISLDCGRFLNVSIPSILLNSCRCTSSNLLVISPRFNVGMGLITLCAANDSLEG